jgi:hypothetical protein
VECFPCGVDQEEICPPCPSDGRFDRVTDCEDEIYLQFQIPDTFNDDPTNPTEGWYDGQPNPWLYLEVVYDTGEIINTPISQICDEWNVGYIDGRTVQNVLVSMPRLCNLLPDGTNCFYFRVKICEGGTSAASAYTIETFISTPTPGDLCSPVGSLYASLGPAQLWDCTVTGLQELTFNAGDYLYNKATGLWYEKVGEGLDRVDPPEIPEGCDVFSYCYTLPFKLERCQQLVTFEADFLGFDCLGNYYGELSGYFGSSNFFYKNIFKVRGTLEVIAYPIEIELNDANVRLKRTMYERALLRTWGMPEIVAKRIANVFMGDTWSVNGQSWDNVEEVAKNNDTSSYWWINLQLEREICEKPQLCQSLNIETEEITEFTPPKGP